MRFCRRNSWKFCAGVGIWFACLLPVEAASLAGISLSEIAKRCAAQLIYGNSGRTASLEGNGFKLDLTLDNACYRLNGVRVYGQRPVGGREQLLVISPEDWQKVLVPLLAPEGIVKPLRIFIDAGHGGNDTGAVNRGFNLTEKQLTLDVAKRVREALQTLGFQVFLSREDDIFVPLLRRSEIANDHHADLFISIHFNSADAEAASGIETYVIPSSGTASTSRLGQIRPQDLRTYPNNAFDAQNLWLGYCVERQLVKSLGSRDRGLKRGRFKIFENLRCPAALVECGFISNGREGNQIASAAYRDRIAQGIVQGIRDYVSAAR